MRQISSLHCSLKVIEKKVLRQEDEKKSVTKQYNLKYDSDYLKKLKYETIKFAKNTKY